MHAKHFLITMHNYYETPIEDCEGGDNYATLAYNIEQDLLLHGRVEYARWQVEKGEDTGKVHIQMLLSFNSKQHESALRGLFKAGYGHAEVVANYDKSVEYCGKAETRIAGFWEVGKLPGGQGERVDLKPLDEMAHAVHAGSNLVDVVLHNPTVAARGLKMLQLVSRPPKRYHLTRWLHLWGPSGVGKTKAIKDCIEGNPQLANEFHWKNPFNRWFDEYLGQTVEVIDDFDHLEPTIAYKEMLSLLDAKPFQVEFKGGSTQFTSHLVIITSSAPCSCWYPRRGGDLGELMRRLHDFGQEVEVKSIGDFDRVLQIVNDALSDAFDRRAALSHGTAGTGTTSGQGTGEEQMPTGERTFRNAQHSAIGQAQTAGISSSATQQPVRPAFSSTSTHPLVVAATSLPARLLPHQLLSQRSASPRRGDATGTTPRPILGSLNLYNAPVSLEPGQTASGVPTIPSPKADELPSQNDGTENSRAGFTPSAYIA